MKFIYLFLVLISSFHVSWLYAAVFAEDDRKAHDSRNTGAVLCAKKNTDKVISIGTASLVKTKHVANNIAILTNEHVIRDLETGEDYDCWFAINADLNQKVSLAPQRLYGGKFESGNNADDWALAKLESPVSSEIAASLSLATSKDESYGHNKSDFSLVAYNSGSESNQSFTAEMTITQNCRVFMADESPLFKLYEYDKLLITDCDCYEGCSGAPIINSDNKIVGVYLGSHFADRHYIGGSQRFTEFDLFRYVNSAVRVMQFHINEINNWLKRNNSAVK